MYAIIKTGGKQYKVSPNDIFEVEKIDVESGKAVNLEEVLLVSDEGKITVGQPTVKGAKVKCEVVKQYRGEKVISFKYKRRKDFKKKIGHRQSLTSLKVKEIAL